MPSREGFGLAWDRYEKAVDRLVKSGKVPGLRELDRSLSARKMQSLGGFWLVWQLEGGFEGMRRLGLSEASIYRKVAAFRKAFGKHPDDFEMPGVRVDLEEYLKYEFDPATKATTKRE